MKNDTNKPIAAIAMSGGVDSAVAALLLRDSLPRSEEHTSNSSHAT